MQNEKFENLRDIYPPSRAVPQNMPRPTFWPVTLAFGTVFMFWGIITSPIVTGVGLVVFVAALVGWISELGNE